MPTHGTAAIIIRSSGENYLGGYPTGIIDEQQKKIENLKNLLEYLSHRLDKLEDQ